MKPYGMEAHHNCSLQGKVVIRHGGHLQFQLLLDVSIIGVVCYSSHLMIPSNITSKWCLSNCEQHKEAVTSSLLVYGARQGNLVRWQIQLCYICRQHVFGQRYPRTVLFQAYVVVYFKLLFFLSAALFLSFSLIHIDQSRVLLGLYITSTCCSGRLQLLRCQ